MHTPSTSAMPGMHHWLLRLACFVYILHTSTCLAGPFGGLFNNRPKLSDQILDGDTIAVQTAAEGGSLRTFGTNAGLLTMHGVHFPTVITNTNGNASDPLRIVSNTIIAGEVLPRFALLSVNWTSIDQVHCLDNALISLEIIELVEYEEAVNDVGGVLEYAVKIGDVFLKSSNSSNMTVTSDEPFPSELSFDEGSLMVDLVPTNADTENSLRAVTASGKLAAVYRYNAYKSTGQLVEAQGALTLWLFPYGITSILFCCTAVPISSCFGCWPLIFWYGGCFFCPGWVLVPFFYTCCLI